MSFRAYLLLMIIGLIHSVPPAIAEDQQLPNAVVTGLYDGAVAGEPIRTQSPQLQCVNPQEMTNVTLIEVFSVIETLTQTQVVADWRSIENERLNVSQDTIIPVWPAGETVQQLLRRIPGDPEQNLTWVVDSKTLQLTTVPSASEQYTTQRYFMGDLINSTFPAEELIEMLTEETSGPWDDEEPGTGLMTPFGNHLFVRTTSHNHLEVQGCLNALRLTAPIVLVHHTQEDLRLRKLLEDRIVSFDWPEITLGEFARKLSEMIEAPIRIDAQTLQDCGIDQATTLHARAKDIPLHRALQINIDNVNGTACLIVIEDGAFVITSGEKACEMYETILYNVGAFGITGQRLDEFAKLLERETTGPWDSDEPGTGTISLYPSRNSVLIRQTSNVHREILVILRDLRSLPTSEPLFPPVTAADTRPVTKCYSMAPETAKALLALIPDTIADGTWEVSHTPSISSRPPKEEGAADQDSETEEDSAKTKTAKPGRISILQIPERQMYLQTIDLGDPTSRYENLNSWYLSGKGELAPAMNYLVIRHTPAVHDAVSRLIARLHGRSDAVFGCSMGGQRGSGFFEIPAGR